MSKTLHRDIWRSHAVAPEEAIAVRGWGAAPTGKSRPEGKRHWLDLGGWYTLRLRIRDKKNGAKKNSAFQSQSASNKGFHKWRIYLPIPYQLENPHLADCERAEKNLSSLSSLHSLQTKPMRKSRIQTKNLLPPTHPFPPLTGCNLLEVAGSAQSSSAAASGYRKAVPGTQRRSTEFPFQFTWVVPWDLGDWVVKGPPIWGTKRIFHGQGDSASQRSW